MAHKRVTLVLAVLFAAYSTPPAEGSDPPGPTLPSQATLDRGVAFLLEEKDGTSGCVRGPSTHDWTVQAIVAAGHDPRAGSPDLVDGLAACEPEEVTPTSKERLGAIARHILAIASAGENPSNFKGTGSGTGKDWIAELTKYWTDLDGPEPFYHFVDPHPAHANDINDDIFAVIALVAAGVPPTDTRVAGGAKLILDNQNPDGGWSFKMTGPGATSSVDMTAAALEALRAAGVAPEPVVHRAVEYLEGYAGRERGCSGQGAFDESPNPDSSAWAMLGLLAAHHDPRSLPFGRNGGLWNCLLAHQKADGGFGPRTKAEADPSDGKGNFLTTPQAILALAAVPHGRAAPDLVRPSATFSTSHSPIVGEPVDLIASGVAFAGWQDSTGTVVEGATAEWWPTTPGRETFEVLLVDEAGVGAMASFEVEVKPASSTAGESGPTGGSGGSPPSHSGPPAPPGPAPPSVSIVVPELVERNVTTTVDLHAEPGASPVVEVRLDWGDGTATLWQPATSFERTYTELGERSMRAWARDDRGRVSEPATATIVVQDAAPRLTVDGPETLYRHHNGTFVARAWDPDGPAPMIAWTEQSSLDAWANVAFSRPGQHRVTATATDGAGNAATASYTTTVLNLPPTIEAVKPLTIPPNTTTTIHARTSDPDGDPLRLIWSLDQQERAGPELDLVAGSPGNMNLTVNASDPYGGWTLAEAIIHVAEKPAPNATGSLAIIERRSEPPPRPPPTDPTPTRPPVVILPRQLRLPADRPALLHGEAGPHEDIARVEVVVDGPVPVYGTSSFAAQLPSLPAGTYLVLARAQHTSGQWGPLSAMRLVVVDEALEEWVGPTVHVIPPPVEEPRPAPWPSVAPLLALFVACAARWRRPM